MRQQESGFEPPGYAVVEGTRTMSTPKKKKNVQAKATASTAAAPEQARPYRLEFYQDEAGNEPARRWMKEELTATQRRALGVSLQERLQQQGIGVCATRYGRQLGDGLFEFRLAESLSEVLRKAGRDIRKGNDDAVLLRVFCHAYGDKIVLLLAGYDKARDPKHGRQQSEIAIARARLVDFKNRHKKT